MKINAICISVFSSFVFCASVSAQTSSAGQAAVEIQKDKCDFQFGRSSGWMNLSRFYREVAREDLAGKAIVGGAVLFYAKFNEIEIGATAQSSIENRDSSPLNPNWKWPEGQTLKVWSEVTFNDGNTWYKLIGHASDSIKTMYWTSNSAGELCGNVLSYEKKEGRYTTTYGLPNIYQSKPLIFSEIEAKDPNKISISIAVKELVGNIANIQTNIAINGKSIYSRSDSVDVFGGDFEVSKIKISTRREAGQTIIESIQTPSNVSKWLHNDLKISQRY